MHQKYEKSVSPVTENAICKWCQSRKKYAYKAISMYPIAKGNCCIIPMVERDLVPVYSMTTINGPENSKFHKNYNMVISIVSCTTPYVKRNNFGMPLQRQTQ